MIKKTRALALTAVLGLLLSSLLPGSASAADPTIVLAGDIAPSAGPGHSTLTADLTSSLNPTVVAPNGDTQYDKATDAEYARSYAKSWGRFASKDRPAVGNHEYGTVNAQGYRNYFGNPGGVDLAYAYNIGSYWRAMVVDSNPEAYHSMAWQAAWIKRDAAANPHKCYLLYFHHPLRSTSGGKTTTRVRPIWDAFYAIHGDVIVNGHAHVAEEWEQLTPSGVRAPGRGIKQFTSGLGGRELGSLDTFDDRLVGNHQYNGSDAVLHMTLRNNSYAYKLVTTQGTRWASTRNCNA